MKREKGRAIFAAHHAKEDPSGKKDDPIMPNDSPIGKPNPLRSKNSELAEDGS